MLLKLAITAAAVMLLIGQTGALRHPLFLLLLPRPIAARLRALPLKGPDAKTDEKSGAVEPPATESRQSRFYRRLRIVGLGILIGILAAWTAIQAMIEPPEPRP